MSSIFPSQSAKQIGKDLNRSLDDFLSKKGREMSGKGFLTWWKLIIWTLNFELLCQEQMYTLQSCRCLKPQGSWKTLTFRICVTVGGQVLQASALMYSCNASTSLPRHGMMYYEDFIFFSQGNMYGIVTCHRYSHWRTWQLWHGTSCVSRTVESCYL